MNSDNLLITNEISKSVRDKYYKEPSTCDILILCEIYSRLSLYNLSDSMVESGVTIYLTFYIFIFYNRSRMYIFWDKKSPKDVYVTFTLGK